MNAATIDSSIIGYSENENLFFRSSLSDTQPLPDSHFTEEPALSSVYTFIHVKDKHIATLPSVADLQVESLHRVRCGIARQARWWRPPSEFFFQYIAVKQPIESFNASFYSELLSAILSDLWSLPQEAIDEGIAVPPYETLSQADRLIRDMFALLPMRFEVYATDAPSVEIDAPNLRGSSVIVSCDNQGTALCTVNIKGKDPSAEYAPMVSLPNSFLKTALQELVN